MYSYIPSEEDECAICLDPYNLPIPNCIGDLYIEKTLSCGHVFHRKCIMPCTKCPLCELNLKDELSVEQCELRVVQDDTSDLVKVYYESSQGSTNMHDLLYCIQEVICVHRSYFRNFDFQGDYFELHIQR